MPGEIGAHLGGRAIAVVGERLDDHRDAARAVTFVADLLVILALAANPLFDRALDVLRHRFAPGGIDRRAEARGFIAGSGVPPFSAER